MPQKCFVGNRIQKCPQSARYNIHVVHICESFKANLLQLDTATIYSTRVSAHYVIVKVLKQLFI